VQTVASAGFRSRVAPSGAIGLALAKRLAPAAITLDVMMPGMDGWQVLQALKTDEATAQIPVIVCSIVDNRALVAFPLQRPRRRPWVYHRDG
jgi:CheY-like chemotaxis protein